MVTMYTYTCKYNKCTCGVYRHFKMLVYAFLYIIRYNYSIGLVGHTVECGDTKNVTVCQKSSSSGATYIIAKKPSDGKLLELVGGKVCLFVYIVHLNKMSPYSNSNYLSSTVSIV